MRHDHNRPFDIEADEAHDITSQFWGATRGWSPHDVADRGDGEGWQARTTGSLQAIRDGFTGGRRRQSMRAATPARGIDRTRSHGIVRPDAAHADGGDRERDLDAEPRRSQSRDATLGELAAGWADDDEWSAGWSAPTQRVAAVDRQLPTAERRATAARPRPNHVEVELDERPDAPLPARRSSIGILSERLGVGAVDPLLARLGAIVAIGVLMVPVALAARSGGATISTPRVASLAAGAAGGDAPDLASGPIVESSAAATAVASAGVDPSTSAATEPSETPPTTDGASTSPASADVTPPPVSATATLAAATAEQPADRVEPVCALTYEAGAGDSWYRIADAAGITPAQLIDANLATLDTPIFPGDEICLPPGAVMPPPPTTAPPATLPVTTTPPPTTTATTTVAPTTAPPAPTASQAEVQQIIREIWPDELEQRALEIAYRESRYVATAYNGWCCYGVFQIYYTVHDDWLPQVGVHSAADLFDARKNITAAYVIYQRAGGWGPWGG
jgi:hypothetical protein